MEVTLEDKQVTSALTNSQDMPAEKDDSDHSFNELDDGADHDPDRDLDTVNVGTLSVHHEELSLNDKFGDLTADPVISKVISVM